MYLALGCVECLVLCVVTWGHYCNVFPPLSLRNINTISVVPSGHCQQHPTHSETVRLWLNTTTDGRRETHFISQLCWECWRTMTWLTGHDEMREEDALWQISWLVFTITLFTTGLTSDHGAEQQNDVSRTVKRSREKHQSDWEIVPPQVWEWEHSCSSWAV